MKQILLWIRICRPQTLFASLVPVLTAFLCVPVTDMQVAIVTALCSLSLQILSNLINDYYDFVRKADCKGRVGFRRALAEGEVSKRAMQKAIGLDVCCCVLLGLFLVVKGGWVILGIGVSALFFAWLYTATRHSLSYLGIADIFCFLYYGVVATCGAAYLQTGEYSPRAFYAGGVCGLISCCVLMINNLRDVDSDRLAGKHTPVVRFGKRACETVFLLLVLLMPLFAWKAFGCSPALLILLPGLILYRRVKQAQGVAYNKALLLAGLCNVIYYILALLSEVTGGAAMG